MNIITNYCKIVSKIDFLLKRPETASNMASSGRSLIHLSCQVALVALPSLERNAFQQHPRYILATYLSL